MDPLLSANINQNDRSLPSSPMIIAHLLTPPPSDSARISPDSQNNPCINSDYSSQSRSQLKNGESDSLSLIFGPVPTPGDFLVQHCVNTSNDPILSEFMWPKTQNYQSKDAEYQHEAPLSEIDQILAPSKHHHSPTSEPLSPTAASIPTSSQQIEPIKPAVEDKHDLFDVSVRAPNPSKMASSHLASETQLSWGPSPKSSPAVTKRSHTNHSPFSIDISSLLPQNVPTAQEELGSPTERPEVNTQDPPPIVSPSKSPPWSPGNQSTGSPPKVSPRGRISSDNFSQLSSRSSIQESIESSDRGLVEAITTLVSQHLRSQKSLLQTELQSQSSTSERVKELEELNNSLMATNRRLEEENSYLRNLTTVDIPQNLIDEFKLFKSSKKWNRAFLMKVNKNKLEVELEELMEDTTWEEVVEELHDASPRFLAFMAEYVWDDGRKSYPLFFLYWCPEAVSIAEGTLYASTKARLCDALQINKIFDSRDKEELTTEWLNNKLKFFK